MNGLHPQHARALAQQPSIFVPPLYGPNAPKLSVELVPATCWPSNVSGWLPESTWRKIAREVREFFGACTVCDGHGHDGRLDCHERWRYSDRTLTQQLMELVALCPMCHRIKHFDRVIASGYAKPVSGWLCRTNRWSYEQAQQYVQTVVRQQEDRSRYEWVLDLRAMRTYGVTPKMLGFSGYVVVSDERHARTATGEGCEGSRHVSGDRDLPHTMSN